MNILVGRKLAFVGNGDPWSCTPNRGAIRFLLRPGGLRRLRPPATLFATLRVGDPINSLCGGLRGLRTTGRRRMIDSHPEGVPDEYLCRAKIRVRREWRSVVLHPYRGAICFIIRSGGLRGLRPPATFFATLRVAEVSQLYSYPTRNFLSPSAYADSTDRPKPSAVSAHRWPLQ